MMLRSNQTLGEYRMKVLKYDYKYKFMLTLFWHELAKVFMNTENFGQVFKSGADPEILERGDQNF